MSDASMKERLARAVCNEGCNMGCNGKACVTWDRPYPPMSEDQEYQAEVVDAILRKMLEPSEGMIGAGLWAATPDDRENEEAMKRAWQAMIQHILDES